MEKGYIKDPKIDTLHSLCLVL